MARKINPEEIMPAREGAYPPEMQRLARMCGFRFYRTRVRCRNDHPSLRRTTTGECESCRRDRWTRWRKTHPEKALEKLEKMLTEKSADKPPLAMVENL